MTYNPDSHGDNGKFRKGRSGNPGGRRKEFGDVVELLRKNCVEAAARLVDVCRNGDNKTAVAAAKLILEYGIGKPKLQVEDVTPPPVEEIERRAIEILAERAARKRKLKAK